jgi:hypothetical protein
MIKRVLFNKSHLDVMELSSEYLPVLKLDGVRFILDRIPCPGADGVTLVIDGKLICSFGYVVLLPGVAEVWLFPSIYACDHAVSFVREVKGYIESTAKVLNWHRVQTVTEDIPQHRKWMSVLGFVEEGIMKKYLDQQTFILSARYFDGSNP